MASHFLLAINAIIVTNELNYRDILYFLIVKGLIPPYKLRILQPHI